jgi:hypothetical protein
MVGEADEADLDDGRNNAGSLSERHVGEELIDADGHLGR